jgi:hypothetical protein
MSKIDRDTEVAVEIDIEHIYELHGIDALKYAMKVLKRILDNETD